MASTSRTLAPLVRRSVVATRSYSQTALRAGGATPPLPPFQRLPTPSQKLVEQHDCTFDDGVAPELALDFDCQHVSSAEGFAWWAGGLTAFATLYYTLKYVAVPENKNPAVNHSVNIVTAPVPLGPPEKKE